MAASFLLGGDELVVLDAEGRTIREVPLTDPDALVAALSEVHGASVRTERTDQVCAPPAWATWPTAEGLVVHFRDDGGSVVVLHAGLGVEPIAGPRFGEPAREFAESLPEDEHMEWAYLYDAAEVQPYDYPWGGVAYFDEAGAVASISSPWAPGGDC